MSFFDEVRKDRQPLAHVLKKHLGIRKIVEDLYPDRAHFIYELLQNAEDAEATEASFTLEENSVSFQHNGRPFCEKDIWGITDIGEGTKVGAEDKIGCFGVGFKAVFAYSETPQIWSPTFSFMISELVLPSAITPRPQLGSKTQFTFPFNNPKKTAQDAYAEVDAGLNELAETTLLFLSHLKSIRWRIGQRTSGEVLRHQHSENHIEVRKSADNTTSRSHFLRFSDSVAGLERQHVSVAFALEWLPNISDFDAKKVLAKQFKIVSANPGRVAVFFPAEKEASALRFHLHAPFVPELSRASIKETPVNDSLFKQLGDLASSSLHTICQLNLLSADFLSVLPNPQDPIPPRYQLIRQSIIEAMDNHALTPTHAKSHAPAKHLLQAKASLKEWLSSEDLEYLIDYEDTPPEWAIAASQKNSNADRFLAGLGIREWDIEDFITILKEKSSEELRFVPDLGKTVSEPDAQFMKWLRSKSHEWHQQMYALFYDYFDSRPAYQDKVALGEFKHLRIIRLSSGKYSIGSKCYFPSHGVEHDELLPRVDKAIYSSGKNKAVQDQARKLLEEIGVREVGEAEQVQAILEQRYKGEGFQPDLNDLEQFVALIEKDGERASIFKDYYILQREDGKWGQPSDVYLDVPLLDTGLRVYFNALGADAQKVRLADDYRQSPVSLERFIKFAKAVGVQSRLEIRTVSCRKNPAVESLVRQAPGNWSPVYGVDEDHTITGLASLLKINNEPLSRLVWKTACDSRDTTWLWARYRNNSQQLFRKAPSQLVWLLRNGAWIPQTDGRFVRPSEASRSLLPKGFPYDDGYEWLKAIRFGTEVESKIQEPRDKEETAKALGFPDAGSLDRAKRFAALLSVEDQEKILAKHETNARPEFPNKEPLNPTRRAEGVKAHADDAPGRIREKHLRSVSVGLDKVKNETEEYLRDQYSNPDQVMFCQICQNPLPFKLDDGRYYFESVEFLPELKHRHYQNYLALCPNHAAMFQHANGSREKMKELFSSINGLEIAIVLAQSNVEIRFTQTHVADLKTVIHADQVPES